MSAISQLRQQACDPTCPVIPLLLPSVELAFHFLRPNTRIDLLDGAADEVWRKQFEGNWL